jgi:NAD(P)-dependent dehydrogenase (short-subunit alcohol dehydrogenase family)
VRRSAPAGARAAVYVAAVKILVVGASGVLGRAVVAALDGHDIIEASRSGQHSVDLRDPNSVAALYAEVGELDAVACAAGVTPFNSFTKLGLEDYRAGLEDKVLGQIELVRQGVDHVADNGSFTLVSGILASEPIETGTVASTVNGAIDAFVRAAATGLPRGLRINAVSATAFVETWHSYAEFFPGFTPIPVADVGRAFARSILGVQTGQVYRVGY